MSGHVNGAIVKFNKLANSNSIRIGCGLHIINIVFTNFENEAFGCISGFSRKPHPFNLLYITWHLHNGYGNNNSGAPMNIKSDYIQDLYKALIGYCHSQYQMPLQTHWGYELRTAEQYLERRESHLQFAEWFIRTLKSYPNATPSYLNNWRLFHTWLNDKKLNIQLKCLVKFGNHFFNPLMEFIVGQDNVPRIFNGKDWINLPPGRRAHEIPDKV
ncbi:hypothetical protein C2G38_596117 [Gigaspora rosea]|uniref:Uncharacterized protein n=1 Tax=Gigaspora rosea TaxID=44941 RepID=A0A397U588_9GLOM|nr:hypothetical protein C2G38_596117 [Gigaspora rosea]